ncbi:MAG TPA: tetratricopeptide repeat protein [Kiritimatiellia bacterium]|nr:tetratricopeptide repeat protein [Kiritimatiellia bacterium]HRZ13222.1 tetratricopeptide repeat protein [Kiritimatiellia bacterium]HSA18671.1 tetratricopeptide repeat protein [Kiritimatiellia bacterium]
MRRAWFCLAAGLLAAGCSSPPKPARPSDPDLDRYASSAQISFKHGDYAQAEKLYRRALDRARAADDALEIGNNAYNLAVCLVALGRNTEARPLLHEARGALEELRKNTAEVLLLDASAARNLGILDAASALLLEARAQMSRDKDRALWIQSALVEAQVACDRNDAPGALRLLDAVSQDLKQLDDPLLKGRNAGLLARVAWMTGQPATAAAWLDKEAGWYRKAGRPPQEISAVLRRAGEAWGQAGQNRESADRYYRAARSLFGQGRANEALKCIGPALTAAEKAADRGLMARIAALFDEIRREMTAEAADGARAGK